MEKRERGRIQGLPKFFGTRLKPVVIFKRKTLPKGAKFTHGVVVKAHPKGWMDEKGTMDWLEAVWKKPPGALLRQQSLLVWDMFRAHITDDVKEKAKNLNTDLKLAQQTN